MLEHKSECSKPPIPLHGAYQPGSFDDGCWHPKSFDRAVVVIIDALRYDFTVPFRATKDDSTAHHYHDAIPVFYETAKSSPEKAVLRPFVADPPTTTLQRLKGLTTGTLPTFIDAGSNFAGTAIDEDNLVAQTLKAGKNVVHLGDDTWHSLFPGYFDPNLTKAYDSFNVWDLHTVDNGVTQHILPLMQPANASQWDVIFGHYLGVDHAGHRYGPDHPAMRAKLQQMDHVIRQMIELIDDRTLLVVMGDHGMDSKGDHGGESADEVEAALWMYSKAKHFGRTSAEALEPPPTAKVRPVNQIDLVPTLAMLLGMPIPFNNLGSPIEEAFVGSKGTGFENFAMVNRLAAAQIHQYQKEYALVRKPDPVTTLPPLRLWQTALELWDKHLLTQKRISAEIWREMSDAFFLYQQTNLKVCKDLWARFDLVGMAQGIVILLLTFIILGFYARTLSLDAINLSPTLFLRGSLGLAIGAIAGLLPGMIFPTIGLLKTSLFSSALTCCGTVLFNMRSFANAFLSLCPDSLWSWTCVLSPLLLSAGFASNSFIIWEDETLLFFLAIFGTLSLATSFHLPSPNDRRAGCYHSLLFMVLLRTASLSRLCREEQMPYCRSTFYASAASSTSAPWQLGITWLVALILPDTIKSYYKRTQSYHGSAPFWIGIVFRISLLLVATFWTLEVADDNEWFNSVRSSTLKTTRMVIAQLLLAIAAGAGTATFAWQSPCIGVETLPAEPSSQPPQASSKSQTSQKQDTAKAAKQNGSLTSSMQHESQHQNSQSPVQQQSPQIVVHGTLNLHGSHNATLPLTVLLIPLLLVSKPMGQLAIACSSIAILSLLELVPLLQRVCNISGNASSKRANMSKASISQTLVFPTILALLAHFIFFKTGHQAVLASIQWDAAFIPLRTIRYPWSPLLVAMNTLAGPILCAACVPIGVLWRRAYQFNRSSATNEDSDKGAEILSPSDVSKEPKDRPDHRSIARERILNDVARALTTFFLIFALLQLATTIFAGHLRRHLMLYRVFSPRWMVGILMLVIVEIVGIVYGWYGVGRSVGAVADVFGW